VRRNVYLLMSKVLTTAIRAGIIDVSPLKRAGIKQPAKGRRVEAVPLTVDEIEALADGARCQRDRLAILLMAHGGLRAGEVGGLRVQDVDFAKCRISIRQQVVQVSGTKYISPLKTKSARRAIGVPCSITEELRACVETDPPTTDGRLFNSLGGGYWSAIRINEAVQRAAAAAGLPDSIHSHMLGHTAASLLIDDGANIKSIQAFVGHANITETLQTYGHLLDFGGSALAASMEKRRQAYLNGPERPPDQAHATAINQ
jgi:integrase